MKPRYDLRDHLVGLLMAAAYVGLLVATSDIGMTRDEGMYVQAANQYARWFEQFGEDPHGAIERVHVDRAFAANHEHPVLMKSLFALTVLADRKWALFPHTPTLAYRLPAMVMAGLTLWLTYIFGARTFGRQPGAFAAIALGVLPHFFFHAHLACFDVPIVFFLTLTTYCYFRALKEWRWSIATGLAFGLALATKHNAWSLPIIFAIHFTWAAVIELRQRRLGAGKRLSLVPGWLIGMALLGPAVFLLLWPWMWYETADRIREYVSFHVDHEYYNMAYFGVNYFRPPFPVSYPFVMTYFTVPITIIGLALFALVARAGTFLPWPLVKLTTERSRGRRDRRATDVLLVGSMMAPIVMIALPSTPIFGGTKHWLVSYVFLCLYAGYAAQRVARAVRDQTPFEFRGRAYAVRLVPSMLLLAPCFLESARSHPFGLAHYTYGAGATPGAADYGMNRQFWGYTTGSLGDFFRRHLRDGGAVYICDTHSAAFQMMKRDGLLPEDLRSTWSLEEADYAIVHHEHHFAEVDAQIWVHYGTVAPAFVLLHDGVPLVSVYENPARASFHR